LCRNTWTVLSLGLAKPQCTHPVRSPSQHTRPKAAHLRAAHLCCMKAGCILNRAGLNMSLVVGIGMSVQAVGSAGTLQPELPAYGTLQVYHTPRVMCTLQQLGPQLLCVSVPQVGVLCCTILHIQGGALSCLAAPCCCQHIVSYLSKQSRVLLARVVMCLVLSSLSRSDLCQCVSPAAAVAVMYTAAELVVVTDMSRHTPVYMPCLSGPWACHRVPQPCIYGPPTMWS